MSKPVGPYSPFKKTENLVFTSGQIGAVDGVVVEGGLEAEFTQALTNLENVLRDAGITKDNVLKCTIFMTDMNDYAKVNEIYLTFFEDHRPARSAVAVASLPLGALIEIEAIASV